MKRFAIGLALILVAFTTSAQTPVRQGPGNPLTTPWVVSATGPTGAGTSASSVPVLTTSGYVTAGAPAATVAISSTSAAATGLTSGAYYRVACSVPCFFRIGTATPTALTSDAAFYGPAVEIIGLPASQTAIAFVTSGSVVGSCTVTLLRTGP